MTAPILVARGLGVRFGGLSALTGVDLSIQAGSIHSVIGPNGSGKSTLFNCISGRLQPTTGELFFLGRGLTGLAPDRVAAAGISRTHQEVRLFRDLTATENLLIGMHLHLRSHWWGAVLNTRFTRADEERARDEAGRLLKFVGLSGRGDLRARHLDHCEQRRLEFGRALATRPRLLMLDELTGGMNPREACSMIDLIQKSRAELGVTVLLVEHQMHIVMTVSDRVTVLDHGVKIAEGAAAEVQCNRRVIDGYLGTRKRAHVAASLRPVQAGVGVRC